VTDYQMYAKFFTEFLKYGDERCLDYADKERLGKPHSHAASLEGLLKFQEWVNHYYERSWFIMDGGAGASSWMLRHWYGDKVVTVDPDPGYMEMVRQCCLANGLPEGQWYGPDVQWPRVSNTFWDYGTWQRVADFPRAYNLTANKMYLDDADDRPEAAPLRRFVYDFVEALGYDTETSLHDLKDTLDEHGRWGVMLVK